MMSTLQRQIGKRRRFACPEEEAYLSVLRTASLLGEAVDRLFRSHGLGSSGYNALRILRGSGRALRCSEIARDLVTPGPDVTRLVDQLERGGLARRLDSPTDRRVVLVEITARGLEVLGAIDGPLREVHRSQLGHMKRGDLRALVELLGLARARLESPRGSGGGSRTGSSGSKGGS